MERTKLASSLHTEISGGWFDIEYTTFHVSDSRGGTRERLSLDENRVEGVAEGVVVAVEGGWSKY